MQDNKAIVITLILLYCLSSATLAALAKLASANISIIRILSISYVISFILLVPVIVTRNIKLTITIQNIPLQFIKSFLGALQLGLILIAYTHIPLANALILRNLAPLWVPIFSFLLLQKEFRQVRWHVIFLGFFGVFIFLHPSAQTINIGFLYAILSGIVLALNAIITRILNNKAEPIYKTLFYTLFMPAFISIIWLITHWQPIPLRVFLLLLGSGCSLFLTILTFIKSYNYAYAGVVFVTPFSYAIFIFAGFYDWIFWTHKPTWLVIIGAIVILISCYLNIRMNNQEESSENMQLKIGGYD